ncbi:hypothetical protein DFH09DRAFT_131574 [Mycena vulgaris]|nr:hypothetical protein DFH09DRAFT_131574 [Mycena vulgaris]
MLAAAVFITAALHVTAQNTFNIATFTPLEDGTSTSTAFFFSSTSPASSPIGCIDTCFNNATGGGRQTGCVGISGQYECICTFPAMMQRFEKCMEDTCALDGSTVQQTLGNVRQICTSCTPDGCNTFKISTSGNDGGTIIVSATPAPVSTPSDSLCSSSTQSAWISSVGGTGGAVGGGFASAGLVPCGSSASSGPSALSSPTGAALSDAASPSGSAITAPTSDAYGLYPYLFVITFCAVGLGGTLV